MTAFIWHLILEGVIASEFEYEILMNTWLTFFVNRLKELTTCFYILATKIAGPISHFAAGRQCPLH